jgi:AraC-like DNA-binding protein
VQLILDGALDGKTEHELAARLFISSRHLRRLFDEHLGVTPDHLARSRRAHFARRLLDDTDLTAPIELRGRRRVGDRLVAGGGLALRLPFTPPLDWDAMLGYFEARAIAGVESVSGGTYRRTVVIDGDPGVIELSPGGEDHLVLRAHLPHWEGLIHLVQSARRIFNLDADVESATRGLRHDPIVGPLVRARPGIRAPGAWDPFEVGVRAIVGQQVTVRGAGTITTRIVERHGAPVPGLQASASPTCSPRHPRWPTRTSAASASRQPGSAPSRPSPVPSPVRKSFWIEAPSWIGSSTPSMRSPASGRGRPTTSPCVSENPTRSRPATSGSVVLSRTDRGSTSRLERPRGWPNTGDRGGRTPRHTCGWIVSRRPALDPLDA